MTIPNPDDIPTPEGVEAAATETVQRLHRGRAATAEEGGYVGGQFPFGLELDEWGRWKRNRDEERILRILAARRYHGATLAALCSWLNEREHYPSPGGGRWTPAVLHRILKNPIYYRTAEDAPEHLIGPRYLRACHNYRTTGILADPPLSPEELEREAHFVVSKHTRA